MPKDKDKPKKTKSDKKVKKPKPPKEEVAPAPKPDAEPPAATASFDAGRLFERYADRGLGAEPSALTRDAFARLVADLDIKAPPPKPAETEPTPRTDFEAGRLFERFDSDKSSGLDRSQFSALLQQLERQTGPGTDAIPAGPSAQPRWPAWRGAAAPWTAQYPIAHPAPAPWPPHGRDDAPGFSAGQVFERYDANKSGSLELDELRRLVADVRAGRLPLGQAPPPAAHGRQQPPSVGPFASGYGGSGSGTHAQSGHARSYAPPSALSPGMFGSGDLIYGGPAERASHSAFPASSAALQDAAAAGSLAEAYHSRLSSLSAVHARLMAKREAAVHQLARLGARREDVAAARRAVERETLADSEAVLHRLRAAEGLKQSLLAHDAARLASDVEALDAFTGRLLDVVPDAAPDGTDAGLGAGTGLSSVDPARALAFMRAYPELCADADRLLARPLKTDVEVEADDFEREVATRAAVVKRHRALLDLLSAKDAIIHLLLREREAAASSRGEAAASSAAELRKWVGLAERLATELNTARADTEGVDAAAEAARVIDRQARALADAAATAVAGQGWPRAVGGSGRRAVDWDASRPSSVEGRSLAGGWRDSGEGPRGQAGGWDEAGARMGVAGVAAVSDDDEDDQGLASTGNPGGGAATAAAAAAAAAGTGTGTGPGTAMGLDGTAGDE